MTTRRGLFALLAGAAAAPRLPAATTAVARIRYFPIDHPTVWAAYTENVPVAYDGTNWLIGEERDAPLRP